MVVDVVVVCVGRGFSPARAVPTIAASRKKVEGNIFKINGTQPRVNKSEIYRDWLVGGSNLDSTPQIFLFGGVIFSI